MLPYFHTQKVVILKTKKVIQSKKNAKKMTKRLKILSLKIHKGARI